MTSSLTETVTPIKVKARPRRLQLNSHVPVLPTDTDRMTHIRGPVFFAVAVLVAGFVGFGLWSTLAPLSSAAIAPGVLVVESKRQQIEHLEGGIVRQIHVADGSTVRAGDVLLEVESESSNSRLQQVTRRLISLIAAQSRLRAEVRGDEEVAFDQRLREDLNDPDAVKDMALQTDLFERRREVLNGQTAVFQKKIGQLETKIVGLEALIAAERERLEFVQQRLKGLLELSERGFASRIQISEVRAQNATLKGTISEKNAQISMAQLQIEELQREAANAKDQFFKGAMEELQKVETELGEFDASEDAAVDVVARMRVVAPIDGTVVGMAVTSVGSVIDGGERLMEIVPLDDRLVIEALIKPEDIDVVYAGQAVDVRLTAFNPRTTPPAAGRISQVSADRVVDDRSGIAAYAATIEIDPASVQLSDGKVLYPGMPAEVMIKLGERTFADYLLGPIIRLLERGMREA